MRYIWIDTDTGVDDAFALLAGVWLEKKGFVKIEGVSAVCGNVEHYKTFENARNVLHLAGRSDIPVYPGAEQPLEIPLETATYVHGNNGLGDVTIDPSPAPREEKKAWDAIYDCACALNGELELILLGPETNGALALRHHPDLPRHLKRILVMGGAKEGGNRTADAEFNIFVDPQAAAEVFSSGVPLVMCGLDVTMRAGLREEEMETIDLCEAPGCRLFREATRVARREYIKRGHPGYYMHDSCPVLYTAFPDVFTAETFQVCVETKDSVTVGKTIVQKPSDAKEGNALVVLDVDRERFVEIMTQVLKEI